MKWINFLHIYQPANADAYVIKEATEKSYKRIIKALEKNSKIKFTINITGCVWQRWQGLGLNDIIDRLKMLAEKGQIEIVGTAAYHPILPLLPEEEVIKQIKENEQILKQWFKEDKLNGFFLPEMAYSLETAKIIKSLGYEWLILDEIALNGKLGHADFNKIYIDKDSGLKIIFRNRELSKSYVPDTLLNKKENEDIFITATDCELYGLRHLDQTGKIEKLLAREDLETLTISEFIAGHDDAPIGISPLPSSWESTEHELKNAAPYALWFDKKNSIHKKLWQLANLAIETARKFANDKNCNWIRWHLVRGLASCTFWWASAKDFKLFSMISWSPDEIERGVNELIRSIRSIDDEASRQIKIEAEKLYIEIKKKIWHRHWANYWKK